jgi:hypothetical protein
LPTRQRRVGVLDGYGPGVFFVLPVLNLCKPTDFVIIEPEPILQHIDSHSIESWAMKLVID